MNLTKGTAIAPNTFIYLNSTEDIHKYLMKGNLENTDVGKTRFAQFTWDNRRMTSDNIITEIIMTEQDFPIFLYLWYYFFSELRLNENSILY